MAGKGSWKMSGLRLFRISIPNVKGRGLGSRNDGSTSSLNSPKVISNTHFKKSEISGYLNKFN